MSSNENIINSFICKNTDKFINIEDKFYEQYPQYINSKNIFKCNGNDINRFKSLEDNKINDKDIIILKTDYN